jgi:hypothetical protein
MVVNWIPIQDNRPQESEGDLPLSLFPIPLDGHHNEELTCRSRSGLAIASSPQSYKTRG